MFAEFNSVEPFIRDLLCGKANHQIGEQTGLYPGALSQIARGQGWSYKSADKLYRSTQDVLLEGELRAVLIRLNPESAEPPERADEVLYRLRAVLLSVNSDGLVSANEEFTTWLRSQIGYLPQELDILHNLTPRHLLEYIGTLKNIPKAYQVEHLLSTLGLESVANRPFWNISGGKST